MNLNEVLIMGHLVDKPELRDFQENGAVSNFTLAVSRPYKNETDFIDIEAWNQGNYELAQYTQSYEKGDLILAKGRIKQERWEDDYGEQQSRIKVKAGDLFNFDDKGRNYGVKSDDNEDEEEIPF